MAARSSSDARAMHHDSSGWRYDDTGEPVPKHCACNACGRPFALDTIVPDDLWERIKPEGKPPGAGLLCGCCIIMRLEALGHRVLHATTSRPVG